MSNQRRGMRVVLRLAVREQRREGHCRYPQYCELYDEGFKRLGCIGCPLGGYASQKRELKRWPQYRKLYVSAFEKMIETRRQAGKTEHAALWNTGEDVMRWWMGCDPKHNPDQLAMLLAEAG